jgi:hypothetical protein
MNTRRILCATACLTFAPLSNADTFLNRAAFDAMFPGLALQDFESAGETQRDYGDFVLSSQSSGGKAVGTTDSGFPSRVAIAGLADDPLTITFTIPVEAVGFQVGAIDLFENIARQAEVTAFDAGNNVLETVSLMTGGRQMTTFVGFGNVGEIARVRISDFPLEASFLAIDDVAYGIPSPGTLALLALLGVTRRRRARGTR